MNAATLKEKTEMGVVPAMATPLHDDGYRVNVDALNSLASFLLAAGVKGLFVGGTTGEGILLTSEERRKLHEGAVAAVSGRVPVLVHVGANTTVEATALAAHAEGIGADAIVAVTPYFYGMHDDALLAYFQAVAQAAPQTPFLAYDIPHMATNGISPALLPRLAQAIPTLVGLKCSRPDAQVVRRHLESAPAGVVVFAGNESIALGSLAMGAHGLISGLSTAIPEPFVALGEAVASGDLAAARRIQRQINQLLDLLPAGARIGALKTILQERGIPAGPSVPPRPTPDAGLLWQQMEALL